jgi:hypothetical protein
MFTYEEVSAIATIAKYPKKGGGFQNLILKTTLKIKTLSIFSERF